MGARGQIGRGRVGPISLCVVRTEGSIVGRLSGSGCRLIAFHVFGVRRHICLLGLARFEVKEMFRRSSTRMSDIEVHHARLTQPALTSVLSADEGYMRNALHLKSCKS